MFQKNNKHLQGSLFSFDIDLKESQRGSKSFQDSEYFYSNVFCDIDESIFSPLYSAKLSRPNSPINSLVSALILKNRNNWSFSSLFDEIDFNLLVKKSLGLQTIDEQPFTYKTLFNFMNRLSNYYDETGIDLMETSFNNLTKKYIDKYEIETNIQRSDSTFLDSNIKKITRLQLLLEVIKNLSKHLTASDIQEFTEKFNKYQDPQKYIYKMETQELPKELQDVAVFYHQLVLHLEIENNYTNLKEFIIFKRVYEEHFRIENGSISIIPSEDISSNTVQSPYDDEATYKKKRGEKHHGYKVNSTETANPDNPINLITDIEVEANNIDDSSTLSNIIDDLVEKTPDLNELHTDGGYGSKVNDLIMEIFGITHIQTAIRGRIPGVEIEISKIDNEYRVQCPFQEVEATPTPTRNKAEFDQNKCDKCLDSSKCTIYSNGCKIYFDEADYLASKRKYNIFRIPDDRKFCRNNVEATMKEFKCRMNFKGKLKTRGLYRAKIFAFTTAIAINVGRIFRYEYGKMLENILFLLFYYFILVINLHFSHSDSKFDHEENFLILE